MIMLDECIIEHRDRNGKLIKRHTCNSSLWHKFLVKLGLSHNSITAVAFADISGWVSGLIAPTAYTFVCIGTGTTQDAVGDTVMQILTKATAVVPTRINIAQTNDTIQWTHIFSFANDALTGISAVNEVGITSAATAYHLLLHIAGATNYGPVDSCNWDAGDTLSITIKCQIKQGT